MLGEWAVISERIKPHSVAEYFFLLSHLCTRKRRGLLLADITNKFTTQLTIASIRTRTWSTWSGA